MTAGPDTSAAAPMTSGPTRDEVDEARQQIALIAGGVAATPQIDQRLPQHLLRYADMLAALQARAEAADQALAAALHKIAAEVRVNLKLKEEGDAARSQVALLRRFYEASMAEWSASGAGKGQRTAGLLRVQEEVSHHLYPTAALAGGGRCRRQAGAQ